MALRLQICSISFYAHFKAAETIRSGPKMLKSLFRPKPPTPEQIEALEHANTALRGRVYQMMGSEAEISLGLASQRESSRQTLYQAKAA
jgi:hypothetical protein